MSSDFVVSARKYRPDSWEKVVGQDSITSTLKNSIASQKLGPPQQTCVVFVLVKPLPGGQHLS